MYVMDSFSRRNNARSIWSYLLVSTLPLVSYYGFGQALEQFAIASPTFLGHVV
jgi:hypothetical protein